MSHSCSSVCVGLRTPSHDPHTKMNKTVVSPLDFSGRGTAREEDARGTPAQNYISPSILVYKDEDNIENDDDLAVR